MDLVAPPQIRYSDAYIHNIPNAFIASSSLGMISPCAFASTFLRSPTTSLFEARGYFHLPCRLFGVQRFFDCWDKDILLPTHAIIESISNACKVIRALSRSRILPKSKNFSHSVPLQIVPAIKHDQHSAASFSDVSLEVED